MHGLDKISSPYLGLPNGNEANSKTTLTAKKLFEKLNDANTLFGFPTTREVMWREPIKVDRANEKPFQSDLIKEFSPVLSAAAYSRGKPILNSRENENKNNSGTDIKNVFRMAEILKEDEDNILRSKTKIVNVRETSDRRSSSIERDEGNYHFPSTGRNKSAYQTFDDLHNRAFQSETIFEDVPVSEAFSDVKNHEIEDNNVENNVIFASTDCLLTKCNNDFDVGKVNKRMRVTQNSQGKKKVILREPKFKFDNFLEFEFGLKPTNDTFVNYFKKKNSNCIFPLTNNADQENTLQDNFMNPSNIDCSQHDDKNLNKSNMNLFVRSNVLYTESTEIKSSHNLNYLDASRHCTMTPKCCCSCHQAGTYGNINDQYSHPNYQDRRKNFCGVVDSNIWNLETPILNSVPANTQITAKERTTTFLRDEFSDGGAHLKADTQDFSITPLSVSPYFFVPETFRTEREEAEENNSVRALRMNSEEIAIRGQTEKKN
jgi:hypothetical protein